MISPTHSHDRESLSALFDGELHGDASRFAHKRLAQDVQWRQACGTWLLAGDVLRGRAGSAAPAGFADRVQHALAQESAALAPAIAMGGIRRGWIPGAALAASVAVAAWFVAGPLDDTAPAALPAATVATAAPVPAVSAPPAPSRSTAAVTAAEAAPARASARPARGQGPRMADAGSRPPPAAIVATANASPSAKAPDMSVAGAASNGIDATALADPFRLPPAQVASRPWPRAVLPNYPVAGALTAGYGGRPQTSDAADSPGFYPFEPKLPVTTAAPADSR